MKIGGTLFKSRIARRVFGSFVIAGLGPLVAIGLISSVQMGSALTQQAQDKLKDASRTEGQQIYQRLMIAAEVMRDFGHERPGEKTAPPRANVLPPSRMFQATTPAASAAIVSATHHASTATARPTIHVVPGSHTLMLTLRNADRLLSATLAPRYLWGDPAENPYGMDFCVYVSGQSRPLHCSVDLPDSVHERMAQEAQAQGLLEWVAGDDAYLGAFREVFTNSAFDGPLLRVLAAQPAVVATESMAVFDRLFPLVVLLALVLALLLAAWQIRTKLQPVQALLHGTVLFGQGDFKHRIQPASDDEFSQLAGSMNAMAARLGRQFDALQLLSEVDRMILASCHLDAITDLILLRIPQLWDCCWAGVMFVDQDCRTRGKLRLVLPGDSGVASSRVVLRDEDLDLIARLKGGSWLKAPDLIVNSTVLLDYQADRPAYVMPIVHEQRMVGTILLGAGEDFSGQGHSANPTALGDIADRLAVAVSATEREAELHRRAYYDELTGLPNRQLCMDRLDQALAHARRADETVAVLFVDLDRFKLVNDSVGHAGGDEVLREAARRLKRCVREIDTLARLGGDEFLVLLPEIQGTNNVRLMAERILAELARPFNLGSSEVFLSGSVGAAAFPGDGRTAEELIHKADTAMYGAKESGRGRHLNFSDSMEAHIQRRIKLETDLRQALDRSQLSVHYQPLVRLDTGGVVAAEALLRWHHPTEGTISPTEFIGIAEDCGFISILGQWVLRRACDDLKSWRQNGLDIERIAVNVSARQLGQPGFVGEVADVLQDTGIPPDSLELELTESVFVDDVKKAATTLRELKALGVRISIDDFGTGYSALSYLKQLNFDTVKVDRSFVTDLPNDRDAAAITNAIVAMAHTLGKTVIAEGVMNPLQYQFLRSVGIDLGQGALFSMPMSAPDLQGYIASSMERGSALWAAVA